MRCKDSKILPAAGWKEDTDCHILWISERHLASMEHTGSQYFWLDKGNCTLFVEQL